jgi:hypothetical protein
MRSARAREQPQHTHRERGGSEGWAIFALTHHATHTHTHIHTRMNSQVTASARSASGEPSNAGTSATSTPADGCQEMVAEIDHAMLRDAALWNGVLLSTAQHSTQPTLEPLESWVHGRAPSEDRQAGRRDPRRDPHVRRRVRPRCECADGCLQGFRLQLRRACWAGVRAGERRVGRGAHPALHQRLAADRPVAAQQ